MEVWKVKLFYKFQHALGSAESKMNHQTKEILDAYTYTFHLQRSIMTPDNLILNIFNNWVAFLYPYVYMGHFFFRSHWKWKNHEMNNSNKLKCFYEPHIHPWQFIFRLCVCRDFNFNFIYSLCSRPLRYIFPTHLFWFYNIIRFNNLFSLPLFFLRFYKVGQLTTTKL